MRVQKLKIAIALFVGLLCAMLLTACGGNSLTLEEYFQRISAASEIAGQKVDALDAQSGSLGPNSTSGPDPSTPLMT